MAPRTQENSLLTRLLVYYNRIQLRISQKEEMHREQYGVRGVELPCSLGMLPSQHSMYLAIWKQSEPTSIRIFVEASLLGMIH